VNAGTTAELHRLAQSNSIWTEGWKKWGAYLSERQWGTVREDYSADGDAWNYLPHDDARSTAYRWGEDGLGGFSDEHSRLCVSVGLWNEKDPILKERLFGLTNSEGNHGEDVKELYYYLDAAPTQSYAKMLYKYPQSAFPYDELVRENAARDRLQPEYEIWETGVFDEDRYFDIYIEYAKAAAEDILLRVTAVNRGPDAAALRILPQVWYRNTWSSGKAAVKPVLRGDSPSSVLATDPKSGDYHVYFDAPAELLFCENDTNTLRHHGETERNGRTFKDGFHDYLLHGDRDAIAAAPEGTKVAAHHRLMVEPGQSAVVHLRLATHELQEPFANADGLFQKRIEETDEFYADIQQDVASEDDRLIQRQAFAGMIWSKQYYYLDIREWLKGDPGQPTPPANRCRIRNGDWFHLNNADIISMPDKWEYPWYAAWDSAFHCLPFAIIDPAFAKMQLELLLRVWYQHPNGQMPAYEWNFSDVNPPVHAWACWRVYQIERKHWGGRGDLDFLERVFHKLMLNFTWWVNRKDVEGRNLFQGGFLGLDNIGIFDRSTPLPNGEYVNQADGTAWMAMYCLNLMRISLELAQRNPNYEETATKFFEHFLYIAKSMTNIGEEGAGLWDEEDEFYYDALHAADGQTTWLKVRSMVGLIPLFAVETIEPEVLKHAPEFARRMEWFLKYRPDLAGLVSHWEIPGEGERRLLSLLRGHRMKAILRRMLDETEFFSDYGIRALSRYHAEHPFRFACDGSTLNVAYVPAESDSGMFGGNSNWRGPIWFPVNYLLVESLQRFHHYYGDDFTIECPTGSGVYLTIREVADELARRLINIFRADADGKRPVFGNAPKLRDDPHFRDCLLFYEYFHGCSGRGVGASHQTGWTGLVAKLIHGCA